MIFDLGVWIAFGLGILVGLLIGNKDFRVRFFTGLRGLMGQASKGAKNLNQQYPNFGRQDRSSKGGNHKLRFYARPQGTHIHASKKCELLSGNQFQRYGYREIGLGEAEERRLSVCPCVYEVLGWTGDKLSVFKLKDIVA